MGVIALCQCFSSQAYIVTTVQPTDIKFHVYIQPNKRKCIVNVHNSVANSFGVIALHKWEHPYLINTSLGGCLDLKLLILEVINIVTF